MKLMLDKSVSIVWNRKTEKETKEEHYQITKAQWSPELPEDVFKYIVVNYKDNILNVDDSVVTETVPVERIVEEIKKEIPVRQEVFETKVKIEQSIPKSGVRLEDLARNA